MQGDDTMKKLTFSIERKSPQNELYTKSIFIPVDILRKNLIVKMVYLNKLTR